MRLHARLVEDATAQIMQSKREWLKLYGIKNSTKDEADKSNRTSAAERLSQFEIGLPHISASNNKQTIIMHHPGTIVEMTEIVPEVENITAIYSMIGSLTSKVKSDISALAGANYSKLTVDCIVLKTMCVMIFLS